MTFPCNLKPKTDECLSLETWRKAVQKIHTSKRWIREIHCSHYQSVSCTTLVRHFPWRLHWQYRDRWKHYVGLEKPWAMNDGRGKVALAEARRNGNEMDAFDSFSRWSNCFRRQDATDIIISATIKIMALSPIQIVTVLLWIAEWISRIWSSEPFTYSHVCNSAIRWRWFGGN
jgi:hypothetical protein